MDLYVYMIYFLYLIYLLDIIIVRFILIFSTEYCTAMIKIFYYVLLQFIQPFFW